MGSLSDIETLSKILKRKVLRVTTSSGTKPGDNYNSTMQAFDILLENEVNKDEVEVMQLIAKIYPSNQVRRDYNNQVNVFYKEWDVYQNVIPELEKFSIEHDNETIFRNLFAPFHAGQAVDFSSFDLQDLDTYSQKPFNELDQFILLTDVRKTWKYKMVDRQQILDVDHLSVLINAIAKLHALSWSYKTKRAINFRSKFPSLGFDMRPSVKKVWYDMFESGLKTAVEVFDTHLGKDSKVSEGTRKLKECILDVVTHYYESGCAVEPERFQNIDKFLRVPPQPNDNEEPWGVIVHGDCWVNNFLFLYDEETEKPTDVVMVDLQFTRECCPTADLCYLIYTSTDAEFRKAHMESLLKLYFEKFTEYCQLFGVEPLPGFSFAELKRRVHRAKLCGYFLAMLLLPAFLKDAEEADDMDKAEDVKIEEMFNNSTGQNDSKYIERILAIGKEMYRDGII